MTAQYNIIYTMYHPGLVESNFMEKSIRLHGLLYYFRCKLAAIFVWRCISDGYISNKTNSTNLYPPTEGYLRETCKSQNINPIYLTLS